MGLERKLKAYKVLLPKMNVNIDVGAFSFKLQISFIKK